MRKGSREKEGVGSRECGGVKKCYFEGVRENRKGGREKGK